MKVSVALATYNGQEYILEQLDSLRKQTVLPDEVIICDDCSTDNTYSIIREYIKNYTLTKWKVVRNSYNIGYIQNFKRSLSMTSGDIIYLCDQDDIWCSNKIAMMNYILCHNDNIKLLGTAVELIDDKTRKISKNKFESKKIQSVNFFQIHEENFSQGCTMAIRREIVDKYINTSVFDNIPHDWALSIIASCENGVFYLPNPLVCYRLHNNNTIGLNKQTGIFHNKKDQIKSLNLRKKICMYALSNSSLNKQILNKLIEFYESRISFYKKVSLRNYFSEFKLGMRIIQYKSFFVLIKDFFVFFIGDIDEQ